KIEALEKYSPENDRCIPEAPLALKADHEYLAGLQQDTYQYWVAQMQLDKEKKSYNCRLATHLEKAGKSKIKEGLEEKMEAIKDLVEQFREVELALVERGAKSFKELHPDVEEPTQQPYGWNHTYGPQSPEPFEVSWTFQTGDLTDARKNAYQKIFEAVWSGGDNAVSLVKSLTLGLWGSDNTETPLQVSVRDNMNFSPFAIAVVRGHYDLAKAIFEIAQAQYQPVEVSGRTRYTMTTEDSDGEADDDDGPQLFSEIIDDRFTVENIGELSAQVRSTVPATDPIYWNYSVSNIPGSQRPSSATGEYAGRNATAMNLIVYAIACNEPKLLDFLSALDPRPAFSQDPGSAELRFAMKHGSLPALAKLLSSVGAGLRLDDLVKKSGIEIKEKPKYYQGLSVHGRKRADWVSAAMGNQARSSTDLKSPPLLEAAYLGNIESVEWLMSDAPMRHYRVFAKANPDDKRIQNLTKAAGGFDKAVSTWLGSRSKLKHRHHPPGMLH
ncbi:hypothetical protein LTS18_010399, partial [Coniosporium uncinatum]